MNAEDRRQNSDIRCETKDVRQKKSEDRRQVSDKKFICVY